MLLSTTATTAIETCWPTIETFTDLESTITLSSTCRSLHSLLIDATTHKVKVTHFEICNLPPPPPDSNPTNNDDDDDNSRSSSSSIPRNYTTTHIRIPHYTSHALNHIHFPSLHKLSIDFPLSKKRHSTNNTSVAGQDLLFLRCSSDYIEDVHTSAFPILVSQLSHASSNLTSFHLNTNRLLQYEKGGYYYFESIYEIFGTNLSTHCTNLQTLRIVNTGMVRGENIPMYSVALAKSLLATLQRRKDVLRKFEYEVSGRPLVLVDRFVSLGTKHDIIRRTNCDLFRAVLHCTNLEKLNITCSWGPYCDFVTTAAAMWMNCGAENDDDTVKKKKPSSIRHLAIICDKIYDCEENTTTNIPPPPLPVGTMLDYFSECHSLQTLVLQIPKKCWRDESSSSSQTTTTILDGLRNLLLATTKPELLWVRLNFSGFDDDDDRVVQGGNKVLLISLSDMLPQLAVTSPLIDYILLVGLWNVDERQLNELAQCMEKLGFVLKHIYAAAIISFVRSSSEKKTRDKQALERERERDRCS